MKNYIFLFISILFFTSCKKVSVENYENPNTDLISQFFLTKTKPTKLVYQIMQDLKQKNMVNDLELNKFIKKEGFALWDKCVITIKQNNYRRGLNDANLDTVVLVPLALPETETVKSYLEVHINTNIEYELQKQSEYKNYAYGQLKSDNKNAERFALEFMILNSKVFKYSRFKITDKDLFRTDLNTNTSNENNTFYILRIPNINSQAESFDQVNDCYEMEEWYNPNGDECNCSGDEYFTGNTYWVGDCFNGGGGGGGFGSGFGLGLGGSSEPGGSGGGGGWAPIDYSNLISNEIMSDFYSTLDVQNSDFLENLEIPTATRPNYADMKTNSLQPSSWIVVANAIGGDVKTQLYLPGQNNTCATRISYALNYSGSLIPLSYKTFKGADDKNYYLGAITLLTYLKKSFGTNPSNTIHLQSSANYPLTESYIKSQLQGKKGIYVLVANNRSEATGFGASGHVDLLDSDGSFSSGHSYYFAKGGVKEIYLFILN